MSEGEKEYEICTRAHGLCLPIEELAGKDGFRLVKNIRQDSIAYLSNTTCLLHKESEERK